MSNSATEAYIESGLPVFTAKIKEFTEVAEQSRPRLLCAVQRIPVCRDEAEDIVQDALLRAFKGLSQFRGDARMGTWLYSIVQNSICTYLRSHRGRITPSLGYPCNEGDGAVVLDFPDSGRTPEEAYEEKELEQILIAEINKLNSQSKQVLQLCLIEELSHPAAAKALDTRAIAVKSKVYRAKRILKQAVCSPSASEANSKKGEGSFNIRCGAP